MDEVKEVYHMFKDTYPEIKAMFNEDGKII